MKNSVTIINVVISISINFDADLYKLQNVDQLWLFMRHWWWNPYALTLVEQASKCPWILEP